ncbi:hypothetical protein Tco_0525133 [Tanacetum coccineum]
MVTSGLSSLRSVESKCKGGVPDDGAPSMVWESIMGGGLAGGGADIGKGGDSGSDGDGIEGSGGEGIWGSGDDHGESGDDGGVDIARSLATYASDQTGVGTGAGIEILAIGPDRQLVKQHPYSRQELGAPPPPHHHRPRCQHHHHPHHPLMTHPRHRRHLIRR